MQSITQQTAILCGATLTLLAPGVLQSATPEEHQQAFNWYRTAAESGNTTAKKLLNTATDSTKLTEAQVLTALGRAAIDQKAYEKAFSLLRQGAELGDAQAMCALGVCYGQGIGTELNATEGLNYIRKAAEAGDAQAQLILSSHYVDGIGVDKDEKAAASWILRAAEQELPEAMFKAGICFYSGTGTEQNIEKAQMWFRKAAEAGIAEAKKAQVEILLFQMQQHLDREEYEQAYASILPAAEEGNAVAQFNIGVFHLNGIGRPQNEEVAAEWFRKAAAQGEKDAEQALKVIENNKVIRATQKLMEDGLAHFSRNENEQGAECMRKAAEQGNAFGALLLGKCYYTGQGLTKDYAEAIRWFTKAEEIGELAEARLFLGICHYNGEGVEKNAQEAEKWLQLAKEGGNEEAGNILEEIAQEKEREQQTAVLQQAEKHINNKEFEQGVALFRELAEKGNAIARRNMGICYNNGIGVEKDLQEAFKWFKLAAEQGDDISQFCLGVCYSRGEGTKRDELKADEWIRKSAEQGNADALKVIEELKQGYANFHPLVREGLEHKLKGDAAKAAECFRKAAEAGDAEGCFKLSACYLQGFGVEKSDEELLKWLQKASELGHAEAQFNMGILYVNGLGVAEDHAKAEELLRAAKEKGFTPAEKALTDLQAMRKAQEQMFQGERHFERQEYEKAIECFRTPAEQGYANAQFCMAACYIALLDMKEAVKWLQLAAEKGHADAQFNLGVCLFTGEGIEKNTAEAEKWIRKAAEQGHAKAIEALNEESN